MREIASSLTTFLVWKRVHHQIPDQTPRAFSGEVDPVQRRKCVRYQDESRFHLNGNGPKRGSKQPRKLLLQGARSGRALP